MICTPSDRPPWSEWPTSRMVPRGEVGVVIAALGLAAGVFSPHTYALIVAMSLLTSVVTPPVLAMLFKAEAKENPDAADRPAA